MKSLQALRVAFDAHCLVDPDTGDRIASTAATEAALFKLGITPRADDLEDAMSLAGADDTGCVSWDGFKQVYTAFHRTALDPLDVVKRFMLLDTKRTGTIDRATFLKASEGTLTGAERVWESVARPLGATQAVQDDVSALEMAVAMVPSPDMQELEGLICLKYGIPDLASPAATPKRRKTKAPRHPALRLGTAPRAITPVTPPSDSAPPTPVDDLVILPSLVPVPCPVPAEPEQEPEPEPEVAPEQQSAAAPLREPTPDPAPADPEPEAPAVVAAPSPARGPKKEEPPADSAKAAPPEKKEASKKEEEEPKKDGGCCIVA